MKVYKTILILIIALLISACTPGETAKPTTQITVFYTNDEHGWMAGEEPGSGAANLVGLWDESPYAQNSDILIMSGGDNWTGPAISTWFDGKSMVAVMNAMGYDLSTIGNHEFDFGLEVLKTRLSEASFPYLSANLRYKEDNTVPSDLGVEPYTIIEFADLKIGVIGLSNTITPQITNPTYVESFIFLSYEPVLQEYVPQVRAAGADLVFVASHICTDELNRLAFQVKNLDIPLMGGGHCHELAARQVSDTVILSGGSKLASYAYAQFTLDPETKEIINVDIGTGKNAGGKADSEIAEIVSEWQFKTDAELNVVIGYLENEVPQQGISPWLKLSVCCHSITCLLM
jgi:2',3'-cyclic-nucleotide 2'-phosphodiesterase (5'-nucleotidase family)